MTTGTDVIAPPAPAPARSHVRRRRRLLAALAIALAVGLGARGAFAGATAPTRAESLALVLARADVRVDPSSVVWLEDHASPRGGTPALFIASRGDELSDVWYATTRPGREGALLDVALETSLTRSAGAAEEDLVRAGDYVAFVSRAGGVTEAVTVLDLRGEPAALTADWSRVARWQNAISNLQECGRTAGFGSVRYQLVEAAPEATLRVQGERFVLAIGERTIEIDPSVEAPLVGAELVEVQPLEKGVPGGVTWVVDTIRNLSFVGPAPIEWLENRVFAVQDAWDRWRYATFGGARVEDVVAEELGVPAEPEPISEERRALLTAAAAELGWPPPPMEPLLTDDPVAGEGAWNPILDDPFVNHYPGAPPAFTQTFIRPDAERPYVRVYVTMWDPRQVQMRIVPGTREPESASGQRGTGYIPRDERTLRTLVGAFNGGFQSLHGEFGMMADHSVYLPPKPWAATVAVFDDGHVGMGSWPAPNWRGHYFDETLANRQIPDGMIDMRQNLTSMVEDGAWNPWERWWWGAAPHDEEEQTFTYRSGLCLTEEGFFAYFWGSSLGPEALGNAMLAARCARAMHLDMNSGHCGLELYRPYRRAAVGADAPPPIERVRGEYEHDDDLPGARGWRLRARKAVRSMAMRFPRYTAHDPREFFYLMLRPTLPGPELDGGGAFETAGLPHAGWPYPLARSALEDGTWVVRIDPRRAVPTPMARERHTRVLAALTGAASEGELAVFARRAAVGWDLAVGAAQADDGVLARGAPVAADTTAALGVDVDGFLVYAEGPSAAAAMTRARVASSIALPAGVRLAIVGADGGAAPDGVTPRDVGDAPQLELFAEEQAATEVLFPDNAPQPYRSWGYLQGQRVRYFPTAPPRFARPVEEEGSP